MEINGVPVHPLVVHAAVVFTPLAALAGLTYLLPTWRERVRWPLLVLVLVAAASCWIATLSGEDLRDTRFAAATGEFADKLHDHEELGEMLRSVVTGYAVVVLLAAGALHARSGALRIGLGVLVAVGALASLVYVVLTGDAGAQATWGV